MKKIILLVSILAFLMLVATKNSYSASCPSGNGLYCGVSSKGQDPNKLYQCTNGAYSVSKTCSSGCQTNAPGTNDSCKTGVSDTTKPVVSSFTVNTMSVNLGGSFTFSYTVSDSGGSNLKQAELWRSTDGSNFSQVSGKVNSHNGTSASGTFTDSPGSARKYWYGMHVVDNAGNWGKEPIVRQVTVVVVDTTKPVVSSFTANKTSVKLGGSFTFSYAVRDSGSNLKQAELWRSTDGRNFSLVSGKVNSHGGTSASGTFTDSPGSARKYWYGMHVVDNANNWGAEPTARQVTVANPSTPSVPTLSLPANGKTNVSTTGVQFSWTASSNANLYRIVISQNASFNGFSENGGGSCNGSCFTNTTSLTSYSRNMSLAAQTYYWKVRASGPGGVSGWSLSRSFTTAGSSTSLVFPFQSGQTWGICQGYNTPEITHTGTLINSLDLSFGLNSAIGSYGCNPATANSSTAKSVVAPATGKIAWRGATSTDIVCLALDNPTQNNGKSIMLGHLTLNSGVRVNSGITQGAIFAKLNGPASKNGGYSHIHISMYASSDCSGTSIPFSTVFGGSYNFSSNGTRHQWYGTSVSR